MNFKPTNAGPFPAVCDNDTAPSTVAVGELRWCLGGPIIGVGHVSPSCFRLEAGHPGEFFNRESLVRIQPGCAPRGVKVTALEMTPENGPKRASGHWSKAVANFAVSTPEGRGSSEITTRNGVDQNPDHQCGFSAKGNSRYQARPDCNSISSAWRKEDAPIVLGWCQSGSMRAREEMQESIPAALTPRSVKPENDRAGFMGRSADRWVNVIPNPSAVRGITDTARFCEGMAGSPSSDGAGSKSALRTTCHPKRSWLCRVAAGFIHALGGRDIAGRTRLAKPIATGNSRLASDHAPSHQFIGTDGVLRESRPGLSGTNPALLTLRVKSPTNFPPPMVLRETRGRVYLGSPLETGGGIGFAASELANPQRESSVGSAIREDAGSGAAINFPTKRRVCRGLANAGQSRSDGLLEPGRWGTFHPITSAAQGDPASGRFARRTNHVMGC